MYGNESVREGRKEECKCSENWLYENIGMLDDFRSSYNLSMPTHTPDGVTFWMGRCKLYTKPGFSSIHQAYRNRRCHARTMDTFHESLGVIFSAPDTLLASDERGSIDP